MKSHHLKLFIKAIREGIIDTIVKKEKIIEVGDEENFNSNTKSKLIYVLRGNKNKIVGFFTKHRLNKK
jgi:hypothetical protein